MRYLLIVVEKEEGLKKRVEKRKVMNVRTQVSLSRDFQSGGEEIRTLCSVIKPDSRSR